MNVLALGSGGRVMGVTTNGEGITETVEWASLAHAFCYKKLLFFKWLPTKRWHASI